MDKKLFLKNAKNFIEDFDFDLDRYLPILENDYDTLINLGFDYIPGPHLLFTLYLIEKNFRGPSLNIMIMASKSDPTGVILVYHAYTAKTEYQTFTCYTLDELLDEIIEEAKK